MDGSEARRTAIAALSTHEGELLEQVIAHVRADYASYVVVSDELLAASFRQNIEMCVRAVSEPAAASDGKLRSYGQIARRRFELGVPVDDLIRSYRFSIGLIADKLTELFELYEVPPADSLDAYRRIWGVSDAYTAVLVEIYRQHQLRLDTRNHEVKMDFIERLRTGRLDESTLSSAQARFHLSPDSSYRAFFARRLCGSEHDLYAVMVMLESQFVGHRGVGVIRGDVIAGICTSAFDITPTVSISYGHTRPLEMISDSFTTAAQVAATSLAETPGNHYLEEAGWRVSVEPDAPVVQHFESRFTAPLDSANVVSATILSSIRKYLEHNRSYRAAAEALHCHPNTLRYRVARFEEITGASVDDTETILSLQWMFEAHARQPPPDL